jgi:hypothetical protein
MEYSKIVDVHIQHVRAEFEAYSDDRMKGIVLYAEKEFFNDLEKPIALLKTKIDGIKQEQQIFLNFKNDKCSSSYGAVVKEFFASTYQIKKRWVSYLKDCSNHFNSPKVYRG